MKIFGSAASAAQDSQNISPSYHIGETEEINDDEINQIFPQLSNVENVVSHIQKFSKFEKLRFFCITGLS